MATVEMTHSKEPGSGSPDTDAQADNARRGGVGKYRIAIVLGIIAVSFYVLSIVSIMYSRGVGG